MLNVPCISTKSWTFHLWTYLVNKHCFQNGSPDQITMLDQSGSKFCVEPRYQHPDSWHMCQNSIWKLQIYIPGLNVNLNFQVTAAVATATAATTSQELSQSGKSPNPSRAGTKYPVQGIPHFDIIQCMICLDCLMGFAIIHGMPQHYLLSRRRMVEPYSQFCMYSFEHKFILDAAGVSTHVNRWSASVSCTVQCRQPVHCNVFVIRGQECIFAALVYVLASAWDKQETDDDQQGSALDWHRAKRACQTPLHCKHKISRPFQLGVKSLNSHRNMWLPSLLLSLGSDSLFIRVRTRQPFYHSQITDLGCTIYPQRSSMLRCSDRIHQRKWKEHIKSRRK